MVPTVQLHAVVRMAHHVTVSLAPVLALWDG